MLKQLIILCLFGLSTSARAQSPDALPAHVHQTFVGVTRTGTAIAAHISNDDLDIDCPKRRVLIVGGLDGSARTAKAAAAWMREFHSLPANSQGNLALSVIACGNPDGMARNLEHANGSGGDPARGYPPVGDSYLSATNPENQYIWRWIGIYAPDLVIELIDGEATQFVEPQQLPADGLAAALKTNRSCQVGTIDGRVLAVGSNSPLPIQQLRELVESWHPIEGNARSLLQQRIHRSPTETASQLAKVYGHELATVAYIPAVACLARLRLARLTNDATVLPDLLRITEDYRKGNKPTLTEKSSGSDIAGHILWGELFDATQDPRMAELSRLAADRAFDADGRPREAMPTHSEMSDSVFMGCPILAQAGRLTGQGKYFDMCLTHMRFMNKLNVREDGLHRHSPLDQSAWGRGNGFPALGLALALDDLPKEHSGHEEMLQALRSHLRTLLSHQDVTGAWHQVIDHPESYRELTSTCMITYAMIRGVRRGWLDREQFEPAIRKGWTAIKARVAEDGSLVDVCTGTGKMKSLREYLDRTAILGKDPRGGAMSLLVSTEMAQWEKELQK